MTLVIDASVAVTASLDPEGLRSLGRSDLIAPPLLWSETCSVLRELAWRDEISAGEEGIALAGLSDGTIRQASPAALYRLASDFARRLGWAKTYDAEYVALASFRGCPLLTDDARLQRRVSSLVEVVGPADL